MPVIRSFQGRVVAGFGLALGLLVVVIVVTLVHVESLRALSDRLEELRRPTTEASQRMEMSIQRSLATLRGWLLLRDDAFKEERRQAWADIDGLLADMGQLSQNWTNPENNRRLERLRPLIEAFRQHQAAIEGASAADHSEAIRRLREDASPTATRILDILGEMVADQKELNHIDIEDVRRRVSSLSYALLGTFLLGLMLLAGSAFLIVRSVLDPLRAAVESAGEISRQNFETPISIRGPEELTALGESLEQMRVALRDRTRRLTATNEELLQFAYRTSHDLKSPLTASRRLAKYIFEDIGSGRTEEAAQNAKRIRGQLAQLESLVAELLDLAKSDLQEPESVALDLRKLVDDVRGDLVPLAEANGVEVQTELSLTRSHRGFYPRLRQVLANLASNGVKYCDRNRAERFVRLRLWDDAEALRISVADNGTGIPPDREDAVFDMFTRLHGAEIEGSGLGLYIVRKYVHDMNGRVHFESSSEGTVFTVAVPTAAGELRT